MVQVEDCGAIVRRFVRRMIWPVQGRRIVRQVVAKKLAKIGEADSRGELALALPLITHRAAQLDEFAFFIFPNRLGCFCKEAAVMTAWNCACCLRMAACRRDLGSGILWGYAG